MRWCEHIYLYSTSNNLITTMVLLVFSLSCFKTGFSSYISSDNIKFKDRHRSNNATTLKFVLTPQDPMSVYWSNINVDDQPEFAQKEHSSEYQAKFLHLYSAPPQNQKITTNELLTVSQSPENQDAADVSADSEINFPTHLVNETFLTPAKYFGTPNLTVVTTQTGATALIPCTVHHLGEGVQDWTLQIKFVQQRDAGIYECQVSTHPPISIFLHLIVVEARAEIPGPSIRYLTPGSTLRLQCRVVQNTEISEYIFWYHDNRMINYDVDRGINVSTDADFQSSELTITKTRREHSGNYTCVASNTQPASVLVHIFKGDNPAAMYHGHVGSSTKSYQTHLIHIIVIVVAVIYQGYVRRKS